MGLSGEVCLVSVGLSGEVCLVSVRLSGEVCLVIVGLSGGFVGKTSPHIRWNLWGSVPTETLSLKI